VDYGSDFSEPIPFEAQTGAAAGLSYLLNNGSWDDMSTRPKPGVFGVKVITTPEPAAALLAALALVALALAGNARRSR
jgi:hypothetical protein